MTKKAWKCAGIALGLAFAGSAALKASDQTTQTQDLKVVAKKLKGHNLKRSAVKIGKLVDRAAATSSFRTALTEITSDPAPKVGPAKAVPVSWKLASRSSSRRRRVIASCKAGPNGHGEIAPRHSGPTIGSSCGACLKEHGACTYTCFNEQQARVTGGECRLGDVAVKLQAK